MSNKHRQTAKKQPSFATYLAVAFIAASAGFVAVYVNYGPKGNGAPVTLSTQKAPEATKAPAPAGQPGSSGLATLARGQMATFVAKEKPEALPTFTFQDATGAERSLQEWKGKVVLLNLWATWCAPCRKEMPSLDKLQGELGGDRFEVVALSIDKGGLKLPGKFLKQIKIEHLALYNEPSARVGVRLKAYGMPTTLLLNREGLEIGRLVGPAEWDSEDALALLRAAIAQSGS